MVRVHAPAGPKASTARRRLKGRAPPGTTMLETTRRESEPLALHGGCHGDRSRRPDVSGRHRMTCPAIKRADGPGPWLRATERGAARVRESMNQRSDLVDSAIGVIRPSSPQRPTWAASGLQRFRSKRRGSGHAAPVMSSGSGCMSRVSSSSGFFRPSSDSIPWPSRTRSKPTNDPSSNNTATPCSSSLEPHRWSSAASRSVRLTSSSDVVMSCRSDTGLPHPTRRCVSAAKPRRRLSPTARTSSSMPSSTSSSTTTCL